MTVGELIRQLQEWNLDDEVIVKRHYPLEDEEYDISHVGEYYDWSNKEGGSSPAIICEY